MTENAFLQTLQEKPNDDTTRLIFADFLEDQGDELSLIKAQYIRLDCEMASMPAKKARYRKRIRTRRNLAEQIDARWLAVVTKAPIEKCDFRYECPLKWENLTAVANSTTQRYCSQCEKEVVYFDDLDQARRHARRGGCVAIDTSLVRKPGDLDLPGGRIEYVTMGIMAPSSFDDLPQDPPEDDQDP